MKIFCCSDLHSYFTEFITELRNKGFKENDPEHLLVVCGDIFDRGAESVKLYEYLNILTNLVLVRGNHEDLMEIMLSRGYAQNHDISNGTLYSASQFIDYLELNNAADIRTAFNEVHSFLKPLFDKAVDYFETENYIFVHGWIPCDTEDYGRTPWHLRGRTYKYNPEWRKASSEEWKAARWINGIKAGYKEKIIEPNKTIVCGHWHCSAGHAIKKVEELRKENPDVILYNESDYEFGSEAVFEPFAEEGILAIDACTAHTRKVNVVVLEDNLL